MNVRSSGKSISLLDCTLRDGSYQVGFSFTANQTADLVRKLEAAGIDWIEVGHGLGLGAAASQRVHSAESDESYIKAARRAARRAKVGVFAMPAFAVSDDLTRAADLGIDFLRFGIDAASVMRAEPFIRHAARLRIHVTTFLMKTYTLGLDEFAKRIQQIVDWGSDAVAIVDSAGGMTPSMVRAYVDIAYKGGLPVAFHGHNNLQLAVGNAIAAVEAGASVLDASLMGLGRSAGNARIEALAIALSRSGYVVDCDTLRLARLADEFASEIVMQYVPQRVPAVDDRSRGAGLAELVQGLSFVHSGMQPMIDRIAAETNVDPCQLTILAGELGSGLEVPEAAVRSAAQKLKAKSHASPPPRSISPRADTNNRE